MMIESENDAVSMPISSAIGVPSEPRRRSKSRDQPRRKKPSLYEAKRRARRNTVANTTTIIIRESSVDTPAPITPISGEPHLP